MEGSQINIGVLLLPTLTFSLLIKPGARRYGCYLISLCIFKINGSYKRRIVSIDKFMVKKEAWLLSKARPSVHTP